MKSLFKIQDARPAWRDKSLKFAHSRGARRRATRWILITAVMLLFVWPASASQYDFGTINTSTTTGNDLAALLQSWRTALNTGYSGSSRPSYAASGTRWIDTTSGSLWLLKIYDGSSDAIIGSVNTSTHKFTPYANGAAVGAAAAEAIGQGLEDDGSGNLRVKLDGSSLARSSSGMKIATGGVGPTELASTAVTAGSYTKASITVDADGRITAASNGAYSSRPTRQYLKSGSSATYTTPANCTAILVRAAAGGGGSAETTNAGGVGGNTIFNSINASGGGGGSPYAVSNVPGSGGTGGTGVANLRIAGGAGTYGNQPPSGSNVQGGGGGNGVFGGGGLPGKGGTSTAGGNGATNSGGGGGGGGGTSSSGTGGGAGEYFELYISSPASTYTYTVGAGGAGGAAGIAAGGAGGSGLIIVEEYY